MAKKIYLSVGSMNEKKEADEDGRPQYHLKLDSRRKITIDGKLVKSLYMNINRPETKFKRMAAKGTKTPAEAEAEIARFQKGGDLEYVKFEIEAVFDEE